MLTFQGHQLVKSAVQSCKEKKLNIKLSVSTLNL